MCSGRACSEARFARASAGRMWILWARLGRKRMRNIGHFIGGRQVDGASGRHADVFQPMTGEVIARVALASKAEVRAAVEDARAAQPAWAATNPQRRARVLMRFLDLVARDKIGRAHV